MEQLILANAIADRRAYDAVVATNHQESLSDVGTALWKLIEEFYLRDAGVASVNTVVLQARADQAHPGQADTLRDLISTLDGKACPGNFSELLLEGRRQALREQMTMRLMEGKDEEYAALHEQFSVLSLAEGGIEHNSYLGTDPAALCEAVGDGERIPLSPAQLNANIRQGLLRGHHAIIFGRPEAGKSLHAINCLISAARAGYRVGWIENEDPIVVTQLRAAQCAGNATEAEIKSGGKHVRKALEKVGWYERVFFRDAPSITLPEIVAWVKHNHLDFIVVNQLPGVRVKSDNRVLELETIAKGLREIAKAERIAVLSVIQAGDSGDQKRVLKMGDVDWSNTAVQAACDLLIGFGVDDDLEATGQRMLSPCKNKLGGTHEPILIRVDTERNYVD